MKRLTLLIGLAGLGACAGDDSGPATSPCEEDDRAGTLAVGDTFEGDALSAEITSLDPDPPEVGENTWVLTLSEAVDAGCTASAEPFMPDHGHGADVGTVTVEGDTVTIEELSVSMGGYWEVEVILTCDGEEDRVVPVKHCVDA